MARVRRASLALVALAALAIAPRRAAADDRPTRVAVVATVAVNVGPEDVQSLVGAFQRALAKAYLVEVVAGPSSPPRATCASDTACLVDLGNRLGADRLVFLVLSGVGRKLRIDATLAEPDRHITHAPAMIVELGASDLDDRLADYTHTLLPGVPSRPAPSLLPSAPVAADATAPSGVAALHAAATPEPAPRRHDRAAWISFGAAAVLLTGGLVAGHYASSAYDEYKTTTSAARYDLLRQRVSRDATIANGLYIAGGGAAAVGAGLLVFHF